MIQQGNMGRGLKTFADVAVDRSTNESEGVRLN